MGGVNVCIKHAMFTFNFLFWAGSAFYIQDESSRLLIECICQRRKLEHILYMLITWTCNFSIWTSVVYGLFTGIFARNPAQILGEEIYDINPHVAMNMLTVVGAIITILGFLGCCGTVAENRFVLFVYFVGLLLIIMMQLSAGFLTVNFKTKTAHILNEILYENVMLLTATDDAGKTFQAAIAIFQEKFKCCGLISGPSDWGSNFQNYFMTCTCIGAPIFCTSYQGQMVYKQPCAPLIKKVVSDRVEITLWLAFGLAVFEVLGLIFSMILFCQIRKK